MTVRVLFLCPHSAGKSVLAATYFTAAAARTALHRGQRCGFVPDAATLWYVATYDEATTDVGRVGAVR
jgi:hypothetical protein